MLTSVHIDADDSGDQEIVWVNFDGDDLNERMFLVPYPRGRIMLEYIARICIEDRLDMIMEGREQEVSSKAPKAVKAVKTA